MARFRRSAAARGAGGNDLASYVTDTSSITNPIELGFTYSNDDDVDNDINQNGEVRNTDGDDEVVSFLDSVTSALTGFPGAGGISEWGYSENSLTSATRSERLSNISFDMNGSIEASLDEIEINEYPNSASKNTRHRHGNSNRKPLVVIPPGKEMQFRSPKSSNNNNNNRRGGGVDAFSSTSSVGSERSSASKKRAPVPPLRDPNLEDTEEDQMWEEDCNYDINPTLMFLVLESCDWREATSLLDGKGLENKGNVWNLGHLFGGNRNQVIAEDLAKKRKKELRSQARTWIVRRERNGVLRWRMLPLHAAMAFNAPFEVVLRLYHLYPGAVRCRNDQGMLPLHQCFKHGNEDKVLELLLDVFPEALEVVDDKGRLPLGCTPANGSDNERRSNILKLFSNFQVEKALKDQNISDTGANGNESTHLVGNGSSGNPVQNEEGTILGAVPRYTTNADYNQVTFNSINGMPSKKTQELVPTGIGEGAITDADRYAMHNKADSENICRNGRRGMGMTGLLPIPEDDTLSPMKNELKSELLALNDKKLALSDKMKRRGLKKLFGKKMMEI